MRRAMLLVVVAAVLLPVVIKPIGTNNEHPGYADLQTGQKHVADLVQAIQSGILVRRGGTA
jgi:hypothetical protein